MVVFAASSLTDAFGRIEREFEVRHPDTDVVVNLGGSSSLVAQLIDGAPADVLATADGAQMDRALGGLEAATVPEVFARNELVVAVEVGNPTGIDDLADLADGRVVVLAAPEVPAGAYAAAALACAGVSVEPASLEPSVRSVATKVALGEADAGIVFRTDVDDGIDAVGIDEDCNVVAEYPIVALTDADGASAFVEFVLGPEGRAALSDEGFGLP